LGVFPKISHFDFVLLNSYFFPSLGLDMQLLTALRQANKVTDARLWQAGSTLPRILAETSNSEDFREHGAFPSDQPRL
jgi:hypothetical protein